jgi:O-antigen/teichoic acid export membrane protein
MFLNTILKNKAIIIFDKIGIRSDRTKNITKQVVLSFLYKLGSMICTFLLIPITINYLDSESYGVWLTLTSFISWFSFFDIGLGNGLRNKFAEAKAKGDYSLARGYISSAYFTISSIGLGLIIVFYGINSYIDWSVFFNTSESLKQDLKTLI